MRKTTNFSATEILSQLEEACLEIINEDFHTETESDRAKELVATFLDWNKEEAVEMDAIEVIERVFSEKIA